MALKKMLNCNHVDVEYWLIIGFNTSLTGKLCQLFLLGYRTLEDLQNGVSIASKNYTIMQDKFPNYVRFEGDDIRSSLYAFLKVETEDFKDSEDYIV